MTVYQIVMLALGVSAVMALVFSAIFYFIKHIKDDDNRDDG